MNHSNSARLREGRDEEKKTRFGRKAKYPRRVASKLDCFKRSKCYSILFQKGLFFYLLSFFVPAAIMTYAFAQEGVSPFGDRQILVVDLWHQYYPFFRVVREKLLTGGSFFYSWENGLGSNFLSLISYYAASPLNWLSVFFDEYHTREALTFILVLKIGFAGAFFSAFLGYAYKRMDLSICVFSVMYALSAYTLGYYWNVMWFDTVALFPLVMLGVVKLRREGKWATYTFSLALSLIANYYVGYFTCIFTVFMFAASWIIEFRGIKDLLLKLWLIVRSSILAVGLSAFMTLPAYAGLKLTYSINNEFPKETRWYESWTDIFANTISYNEPTKVEGLPNFACGMLAILLIGVFLFSEGIKIREKVASASMLALIAVSCNMNKLNFIWHGFHFTNQIPYRFAFIFCFVLAAAAYRAYDIILSRGIKLYQLVLMFMGPVAVIYLNYLSKGDKFSFSGAIKSSAIICGAFWMIFLAAKIFPFKRPAFRNAFLSVALAAAVFSEFVSSAQTGVKTVSTTSYKDYPSHSVEVKSLLSHISNSDDSKFYRTETTSTYTLNNSALYGYRGLSQFSSAANVSVTTFCKRLGLYASEAGNRYYYRTSTPVVNSLFGIKYLIRIGGSLNSEAYYMDYEEEAGLSTLYKSRYPLSIGFMMNKEILSMEDASGVNPFEFQNDLIKLATGAEEPVFVAQPVLVVNHKNMKTTKNGYGNYAFQIEDVGSDARSTYSFAGSDDSVLYGYASSYGAACDTVNVSCGENEYGAVRVDGGKLIESYPIVFPMGDSSSKTTSYVEMVPKEGKTSGNYKLMVYAMKKDRFQKAYDELADEQLELTKFDDTRIEGTVTAKKDGVMFFSIPYEKGWSVYVDGEKAETFKVCHAMLGVEVPEGKHDVELKYVPEGFVPGASISGCSLLLTCFVLWYDRRKRKLAAAAASAPAPAGDEPPKEEDAPAGETLPEETAIEPPPPASAPSITEILAETENPEEKNEEP